MANYDSHEVSPAKAAIIAAKARQREAVVGLDSPRPKTDRRRPILLAGDTRPPASIVGRQSFASRDAAQLAYNDLSSFYHAQLFSQGYQTGQQFYVLFGTAPVDRQSTAQPAKQPVHRVRVIISRGDFATKSKRHEIRGPSYFAMARVAESLKNRTRFLRFTEHVHDATKDFVVEWIY